MLHIMYIINISFGISHSVFNMKKQNGKNKDNRNFVIEPIDISFGKLIIFSDTKLVVCHGEHYGIVGKNGIGKTTLLNAIYNKQIKVPDNLDIIYVKQEEPETSLTIVELLLSSDKILYQQIQRMTQLEKITMCDDFSEDIDLLKELKEISDLYAVEYSKRRVDAIKILCGLGFDSDQLQKSVCEFSGGQRMKISMAKALFMVPTILILDEPSNHLDLYATIWLSSYLKYYPNTIFLVSHDKYLINEICTYIINIKNKRLNYYTGNYEKFTKQLLLEKEKEFKNWNLYNKKLAKMRKSSKTKLEIEEFIKKSKVSQPEKNYVVKIKFLQLETIKNMSIKIENISFEYDSSKPLIENFNLCINSTTRMALVGKNGIGKSTLLKMIIGEIIPTRGQIIRSHGLKIGYYNQHFEESLPTDINPVNYLMSINNSISEQTAHKYISLFGLEPVHHSTPISNLSGGQKARVKLASFGVIQPHILLLDEPTNHLDLETTESLIQALQNFDGAIILVTHNYDMVVKLNSDLYIMDSPSNIYKYCGDYDKYIQELYNNGMFD